MSERHFRVWRGDSNGGEFVDYKVDVDPGMDEQQDPGFGDRGAAQDG